MPVRHDNSIDEYHPIGLFGLRSLQKVTDLSMKSDGQCVHKLQRSRCSQCGGNGFCTHGRQRSRCFQCDGKGACKYSRRNEDCKECSTKTCVHRRRSYSCVDCGGAGTCEHKVIRSTCKQCAGGSICEHGRRRCRCVHCKVPAKKQQTPKPSHSDRPGAVVSLEQCLFKDVSVVHLTSADLHLVTRAVKSAELANLTDAGRTFRQCVFTPHNKKSNHTNTQLQLRASASLPGSLSVITVKEIRRRECIGILGGTRISLKHSECAALQQNNEHFIAAIPRTATLPNHAFSMKNRGSILRYANHGCFEKANSKFLASGISVEVWSKEAIPEGSEVNVRFLYVLAIIVCFFRSLLITPLLSTLRTQ